MYFQRPGRKSAKTWKKFRKPGENFQESFGHPESTIHVHLLINLNCVNSYNICSIKILSGARNQYNLSVLNCYLFSQKFVNNVNFIILNYTNSMFFIVMFYYLFNCGLQGDFPEVVEILKSMPPRGEGFLGGSLVTSKLEGGL